jgi:hypothetical protein
MERRSGRLYAEYAIYRSKINPVPGCSRRCPSHPIVKQAHIGIVLRLGHFWMTPPASGQGEKHK